MTTPIFEYTAEQIHQVVGGQIDGDKTPVIRGAATLDAAEATDLSFFHNPKYIDQLKETRAKVVLIPSKMNSSDLPSGRTYIRVDNPQFAFAQILSRIDQVRTPKPTGIHPTAVIDPTAKLEDGVVMGPYVVIGKNVHIGKNTILHAHTVIGDRSMIGSNCLFHSRVVLREDVVVGDRVIIQPGAVLGSDGYGFATVQGVHHKIPQIGKVVLGNDVEIGANVTIDRATTGETRIGDGTKIDNLVHIAHNVQIGKHCLIVAQVGISGSTHVGNWVTLAGQVGLVGHLKIGDKVIIAAQSGVMNDVAEGEVLFGSPARPHRESLKLQALYGKLPELFDSIKQLKKQLIH